MFLAIAAAGRGTRLGKLAKGLPKPLVPIKGKPLLGHIFDRMRRDLPIKEIIVITPKKGAAKTEIAGFVQEYCSQNHLGFHAKGSPRRGVGYAFHQAMKIAKKLPPENMIFSVADVLAENYSELNNPKFQAALGGIGYDAATRRIRTPFEADREGQVDFSGALRGVKYFYALAGIYRLDKQILPLFNSVLSERINKRGSDPAVINPEGELRVSWVWKRMADLGGSIGIADLGKIAELNQLENLADFEGMV